MIDENTDTLVENTEDQEQISQENQDQEQTDNASVGTQTDESSEESTNVGKSLTPEQQEWMNNKITERLARQKSSFLKKYGVEKEEELDSLFEKAKSYDAMSERFEKTEAENKSLSEKLTFIDNNINPERYEDVRIYFKGKGIGFTNESLKQELATHPEWLNVVKETSTIQKLGFDHVNKKVEETAEEKQRRFFGDI